MPQGAIPVTVVNSAATGNSFFVNETTGSDSNSGAALTPLATLDAALAKCAADHNDVIYLVGSSHRTSTLAWNKAGVSLVGLAAPSDNDRARISSTGATPFSPLVDVTAQGCAFVNLGTFHGGFTGATGSQVCWVEEGGRNFYSNVQFLGGGDATSAGLTGMRSLTIGGSGENLLVGCTVGLDTIARTVANFNLELLGGTPRNTMRQCIFQALVSSSSAAFINVGAAAMDRYLLLDDCSFINCVDSTATAMAAAILANAAAGGSIIVSPTCTFLGATAIATTGPVYVAGAVPTATTSNIAIHAT